MGVEEKTSFSRGRIEYNQGSLENHELKNTVGGKEGDVWRLESRAQPVVRIITEEILVVWDRKGPKIRQFTYIV